MENVTIYICVFILLICLCSVLVYRYRSKKKNVVGVLKILHVKGESPSIFLELNTSPDFLENSKEVLLKVSHENLRSKNSFFNEN